MPELDTCTASAQADELLLPMAADALEADLVAMAVPRKLARCAAICSPCSRRLRMEILDRIRSTRETSGPKVHLSLEMTNDEIRVTNETRMSKDRMTKQYASNGDLFRHW